MAEVRPDVVIALEKKLQDYRAAAADEAEATPPTPIAAVRSSPDTSLRLLDRKREVFERELMWAAALDRPTFDPLLRRLTPSANDALCGLPSSGESNAPRR